MLITSKRQRKVNNKYHKAFLAAFLEHVKDFTKT